MKIDVYERRRQLRGRIAADIKRRREDLGLSQQRLADGMNLVAEGKRWNQSMVAKLESQSLQTGRTPPPTHQLEDLEVAAAALGASPLHLLLTAYAPADVADVRAATQELFGGDRWREALNHQERLLELVRNPGIRRLLKALLELTDQERKTVVQMVAGLAAKSRRT